MDGITEDHIGRIVTEATGQPTKKRKGNKPENQLALAELAGNAQALPDLSLFTVPLIFLLQTPGLFRHDLNVASVDALFVTTESGSVELDPNLDQRTLRAMQAASGQVAPSEPSSSAPTISDDDDL